MVPAPKPPVSEAPTDADPAHPEPAPAGRLPVLLIVGALVLTLATIVTVVVLAGRARSQAGQDADDTGPLAVPAAPAPGAGGHYCGVLMSALPADLSSLHRRTLADRQPGVAAWGDPAVILRCGLEDPAELTCSAELMQFTDAGGGSVAWLHLSDSSAVTYIAVDRPVRIAVTLPPGSGVGAVQQLSELIAADLPAQPVCTNGSVTPPDNS